MENRKNPKKHRKNNEVISLIALSPSGGRYLPLSELNDLEPMEHCEFNKGEFITVSDSNDMCITARGKVFADDPPDAIMAGFDYYYEMVDYEEDDIQFTSETEAILPSPRSRSNIGVGEIVKINANVAVKWLIKSKLVSIIKKESKELWIAAGDKGGVCTVNASYKKKGKTIQANIRFIIAEPKSLQFQLAEYQNYAEFNGEFSGQMIYHPQNLSSSKWL